MKHKSCAAEYQKLHGAPKPSIRDNMYNDDRRDDDEFGEGNKLKLKQSRYPEKTPSRLRRSRTGVEMRAGTYFFKNADEAKEIDLL